jgi:hypothetical protein
MQMNHSGSFHTVLYKEIICTRCAIIILWGRNMNLIGSSEIHAQDVRSTTSTKYMPLFPRPARADCCRKSAAADVIVAARPVE